MSIPAAQSQILHTTRQRQAWIPKKKRVKKGEKIRLITQGQEIHPEKPSHDEFQNKLTKPWPTLPTELQHPKPCTT